VRIDQLKKEYDVGVRWIAFPLHPETPEEGLTLEELFAGRAVDIPVIQQRLKRAAESLGLTLSDRTKTYNSRLAQELAKWTEFKGKGDKFHDAVFKAYFVDGKNIARTDELVSLATSVGLTENEARHVIKARTFEKRSMRIGKDPISWGSRPFQPSLLERKGSPVSSPMKSWKTFLIAVG
jgi:predicted DsbA family dithiol-disulfide isomerase